MAKDNIIKELQAKLEGMKTVSQSGNHQLVQFSKGAFGFAKENIRASTVSLHSETGHTPVESTTNTPYKAMHTKSSLLRLKNIINSPQRASAKCLDQSCFANNEKTIGGTKRKSLGPEADTRSTKKRKAATKPKKRTSNVFKRVYQTRSKVGKN